MSSLGLAVDWAVQLDRLELEVLRVERLLKASASMEQPDWTAPGPMGQMPAEMVPRAADILKRQRLAQLALVHAMRNTIKHRDAVAALAPTEEISRYVDLIA